MSKPDAVAGAAAAGTSPTSRLRATRMPAASTTMDSGEAQPGPDQRPEPVAGQVDPHREQQQHDPGQHPGDLVQRGVGRLCPDQGVGLRERDGGVHLGHQVDRGEPAVAEPLLGQVDERREVQEHGVAADHDALAVAGEHRVQLPVGRRDRLVPGRSKRGLATSCGDPVVDEAGHRGGEGRGERLQPGHELRAAGPGRRAR